MDRTQLELQALRWVEAALFMRQTYPKIDLAFDAYLAGHSAGALSDRIVPIEKPIPPLFGEEESEISKDRSELVR